jgi:hypothetical protein
VSINNGHEEGEKWRIERIMRLREILDFDGKVFRFWELKNMI